MSSAEQAKWNAAHRGKPPGDPEPFVVEMLTLLAPRGLALDVAAGRGRNALLLARAGMRVIAADCSEVALRALGDAVRAERLAIWPVVADFDNFIFPENRFDTIVNVNFLERALFPRFARALKPGGVLLADTFLIDQAEIGHPNDPRFLLQHYELRELIAGLELMRYREGLVVYPDGFKAWRAGAVARRKS